MKSRRFTNMVATNAPETNNEYRFDGMTLRLFVNLLLSVENINVRKSDYTKLRELIYNLNMDYYAKDETKMYLIKILKEGLSVFEQCSHPSAAMMTTAIHHVLGEDRDFRFLNDEEVKFVTRYISICTSQNYFFRRVDDLIETLTEVKAAAVIDRQGLIEKACDIMRNIVTDHELAQDDDRDNYFDLEEENFVKTISNVHSILSSASHRLQTGMQGFNELLGGGFETGRAYMILGPSGEGKSGVLLNLAVQLKQFNPQIKTKDSQLKPCIAYLTQENSISETIERLWNITTSPGEEFVAQDLDTIIGEMRTTGGLVMSDDNPINLAIVYKKPHTNSTFWFYDFIEEMKSRGYEVVCILHDYVQRIRSASEDARRELRLELGAIVNEECTLAKRMNIVFITVGQLNRGADDKLNQLRLKQSIDRVSTISKSDIGESMQMIANADVVFAMARENDPISGMEYLGFNKIKGRDRRRSIATTVYQPVDSNCAIKLITDIDRHPVHKYTLAPQIQNEDAQKVQGKFEMTSSTMSADAINLKPKEKSSLDTIHEIMKKRGVSEETMNSALEQLAARNEFYTNAIDYDWEDLYRHPRELVLSKDNVKHEGFTLVVPRIRVYEDPRLLAEKKRRLSRYKWDFVVSEEPEQRQQPIRTFTPDIVDNCPFTFAF